VGWHSGSCVNLPCLPNRATSCRDLRRLACQTAASHVAPRHHDQSLASHSVACPSGAYPTMSIAAVPLRPSRYESRHAAPNQANARLPHHVLQNRVRRRLAMRRLPNVAPPRLVMRGLALPAVPGRSRTRRSPTHRAVPCLPYLATPEHVLPGPSPPYLTMPCLPRPSWACVHMSYLACPD